MKKAAIILVTVLMAGVAYGEGLDAYGSAFGTMSKAQVIGQGAGDIGLAVGAADLTSFVGFFAYGMSESTEGRVKLGLADDRGVDATVTFGLDFHYQMLDFNSAVQQDPLDLSLGGFLEYVDFDGLSVFQIGADLLGSMPFDLSNATTLTPYGRFNVRLEKYKADYIVIPPGTETPKTESKSDTELKFGLSVGTCWDMSENFGLYGEFQFDGNDGLFAGLRYRVL